ncbi:hypothetical protein V8V91_04285 [Algoriphagus halophilus]|uniref:hypothetical protein n=1 Tax=Algoriphagus halophilus TaxID=226505 RepID=UPI00358E828B
MLDNNFNYLLAYDTFNAFLPWTFDALSKSSFYYSLSYIWEDFTLINRNMVGYLSYSTSWAWIAKMFNLDIYFVLQLSSLFISSFIPVIFYKILLISKVRATIAFRFSLILPLVSVLFFYSSQILRDCHIGLFYLIVIYTSLKKFSYYNLFVILVIVLITSLFRIESGLFLSVYLFVYSFMGYKENKSNRFFTSFVISIFIGLGVYFIYGNLSSISNIYLFINDYYISSVQETNGLISKLQTIPFFIGDFLSIFYNAIQPVPFWVKLSSNYDPSRPEVYNFMNFPLLFSSFLNWLFICYLFCYLSFKNIRINVNLFLNQKYLISIFIGLVFLVVQASVIDQRRLIGFYFFFILFLYLFIYLFLIAIKFI